MFEINKFGVVIIVVSNDIQLKVVKKTAATTATDSCSQKLGYMMICERRTGIFYSITIL